MRTRAKHQVRTNGTWTVVHFPHSMRMPRRRNLLRPAIPDNHDGVLQSRDDMKNSTPRQDAIRSWKGEGWQGYKPGSVPPLLRAVTIHLDLVLPPGSCNQPGDIGRAPSSAPSSPEGGGRSGVSPYSVLLRVGFARPAGLPAAGELLPHHFTLTRRSGRYVSVALSVGFPLLGVTQHPARWSPDFPPRAPGTERPPALPACI